MGTSGWNQTIHSTDISEDGDRETLSYDLKIEKKIL